MQNENLKFKIIKKENCNFKYRSSIFKNCKKIILGCKVKLIKENQNNIKRIMSECKEKRKSTQPIEYPNSGSIFKNLNDNNVWELIEKVSLRGYKKNGAMISDKHCNFIINFNNAKSEDVLFLVNLAKKEVKKAFNVSLEEEVVVID